MEWTAVIVFVILLLIVVGAKHNKNKKEKALAYERQSALFSPAERSFYGILDKVVGDRFLVFGKVRVADVIKPKKGMSRSRWYTAFNKIKAKHFDFVLCNPDDLSVECVIELDDSSHNKKSRVDRDRFLDKACLSAGLTIHHFKARASYKTSAITSVIFPEAD